MPDGGYAAFRRRVSRRLCAALAASQSLRASSVDALQRTAIASMTCQGGSLRPHSALETHDLL